MKKFISFIPMMQPEEGNTKGLIRTSYKTKNNSSLNYDEDTYFPICTAVNAYAKDEEIKIIAVLEAGNDECLSNLGVLKEELTGLAAKNNFTFSVETVEISKDEDVSEHLKTFSALLSTIDDGDIIYACVTFGTKPTPIVEFMFLNYCYKTKKNVSVGAIIYGKINRRQNEIVDAYIYDITALFYMDEIVNTVAKINPKNPEKMVKQILNFEEDI